MDGGGDKKWSVLYPAYINSRKTVAEGRRLAAGNACPDLHRDRQLLLPPQDPLQNRIESDKAYPRDPFQVGRVRVQLKKDDGSPVNPEITTKKMLMLHVAELVPKHLGRTRKHEPATSSSAAGSVKSTKGRRKKK